MLKLLSFNSRMILSLTLLSMLCVFAPSVGATPITGEIGFTGSFTPTGGTGLADATGISFPTPVTVDAATGDFAPTVGEIMTLTAFDFSPPSTPVSPLWSVSTGGTTYSFDLNTVNVDLQTANFLILTGSGTLKATGFADTHGEWNLTANTFGSAFTFSSGAVAAPIPEPASVALFGLGLAVVGFSLRRRA